MVYIDIIHILHILWLFMVYRYTRHIYTLSFFWNIATMHALMAPCDGQRHRSHRPSDPVRSWHRIWKKMSIPAWAFGPPMCSGKSSGTGQQGQRGTNRPRVPGAPWHRAWIFLWRLSWLEKLYSNIREKVNLKLVINHNYTLIYAN